MARTLTVIFDGEVFRPTQPVDLPANVEYRVTIEEEHGMSDDAKYPLAGLVDFAMDMGIPDLAEQHDHYLYGTPKR
jgi:hypothetical protein